MAEKCGYLLQQRRLADTGIATQKYHGTWDQSAAKDPVKFGKSRRISLREIIRQRIESRGNHR